MTQIIYFIVTDRIGMNVYPFMNLMEKPTRLVKFGDGFTVYETFPKSGNQFWGRITDDTAKPEYALISIGSHSYAGLKPDANESVQFNPEWILAMDAFMRARFNYTGPTPF